MSMVTKKRKREVEPKGLVLEEIMKDITSMSFPLSPPSFQKWVFYRVTWEKFNELSRLLARKEFETMLKSNTTHWAHVDETGSACGLHTHYFFETVTTWKEFDKKISLWKKKFYATGNGFASKRTMDVDSVEKALRYMCKGPTQGTPPTTFVSSAPLNVQHWHEEYYKHGVPKKNDHSGMSSCQYNCRQRLRDVPDVCTTMITDIAIEETKGLRMWKPAFLGLIQSLRSEFMPEEDRNERRQWVLEAFTN